jgi:2-dehydropantoate 2-reductase
MARIAVLGPGGVGGFVAGALVRAGRDDVVVIGREETVAGIAEHGLTVQSAALDDQFVARPGSATALTTPAEVLFVATKAGGLEPALDRVRHPPGLVVPLLNGIEHMAALRRHFGDRVLAGVIRIESDRPAPGQIVQTSPSVRVDLASDDPALGPGVESVAALLQEASIPTRMGGSEAEVLWSKLARLNALSLTTTASDRPIGFVRTDPRWRSALEGAVTETVHVANADGASLDAAASLAELDAAHPELGSSMRRDIAAGREPELDALAGAVLRAARRHELHCPTVTWLVKRVARRAGVAAPEA